MVRNVEKAAFRDRLLDAAEAAGFRGLRGRIKYEKMVTPSDWENEYSIYRGATFNLAHSLTQMLHFRPRNRFEDLDGMYLVGGGTHPGSGLPVIYEGARITARLLCEDFGVAMPEPRSPEARAGETEGWGEIAAKVASKAGSHC